MKAGEASSGAAASEGKARQRGRETGRVVARGLEAKAQLRVVFPPAQFMSPGCQTQLLPASTLEQISKLIWDFFKIPVMIHIDHQLDRRKTGHVCEGVSRLL